MQAERTAGRDRFRCACRDRAPPGQRAVGHGRPRRNRIHRGAASPHQRAVNCHDGCRARQDRQSADRTLRAAMTRAELEHAVSQIQWVHQIDLGQGIVTPGAWDTPAVLERLQLPDLTGQSVLDIGSWDGFYSFAAERRGAARVLATDSLAWQYSRGGFDLAHRVLQSKVEAREIDVLDLRPDTVGTFDIVLMLGILYHMRHPMLALDRAFSVTRKLMVVETVVDLLYLPATRALKFYPGRELGDDESNWFGPTPLALEAMLLAAGFSRVQLVWPTISRLRWWRLQSLFGPRAIKRVVMHAWK